MKITHVRGNAISLAIPLHKRIITLEDGEEKEFIEDFIPSADYPVTIVLQKNNYATRKSYLAVMDNNVAVVHDNKCCLPTGLYSVELYCLDEKGDSLRYMVKDAIEIVDATADAGIEAGVEFNSEIYTLEGATFLFAKGEDAKVNGYNTVEIVGDIVKQEGTTLFLDAYNKQQVDDKVNKLRPTITPDMDIYQEYDNLYEDPENGSVNF